MSAATKAALQASTIALLMRQKNLQHKTDGLSMSPPSSKGATAMSRRCEACHDCPTKKAWAPAVSLAWTERRGIYDGGARHLVRAVPKIEGPRHPPRSAPARVCAP